MRNRETLAVGLLVVIGGLALLAFILSLSVAIIAGLSMLLCNVILPMFDVNYPITFLQGCGVGAGVLIVRSIIGSIFSVNVSK